MPLVVDANDEEIEEVLNMYMAMYSLRKTRTFRDRTDPMTYYNDMDFRARFCVG